MAVATVQLCDTTLAMARQIGVTEVFLKRLLLRLVGTLALLCAVPSHALVSPVYEWQTYSQRAYVEYMDLWFDTQVAACAWLWQFNDARGQNADWTDLGVRQVAPGKFGYRCVNQRKVPPYDISWYGDLAPREIACPANSAKVNNGCQCSIGYQDNAEQNSCIKAPPEAPAMCMAGGRTPNPILPASGEKYRQEVDFADGGPAPLTFARIYRSNWGADPSRTPGPLGKAWTHSFTASLSASPALNPNAVSITSAEGTLRTFFKASGEATWKAINSADVLIQNGDGSWSYRRVDDDVAFNFTADGRLQTAAPRNGWATVYSYNSAGQLATISNGFGRTLLLTYNSAGQLWSVTTPDLRVIGYAYDLEGRLSTVSYPDGKSRAFLYENTSFPFALTGILDEAGARFATFDYDTQGRAIDSSLAGLVDRYQVSYPSSNTASILDPLGTSRTYNYKNVAGKLAVTGGSLAAGLGENDAASRTQDANGLITREVDFKGIAKTIAWDNIRRLPLSVGEAEGALSARTTTTQWHPNFSLPTLVTEAGRITAYTYDALGNLLTKSVTDTASSPNVTRTWSWTYTPQSLVATATEPNGATTTYTHDTRGNVLTATNALGHVTTYTYDTANRVVSRTEPNGLTTTYTYDLRDRLITQTIGGQQTTTLTYKPYGSVETITLPTGLVITYAYDPAHRLTGWSNNRGESGTYTLDNMGNRVGEQVKNANGAVAWTLARTINAINRVASITAGGSQTTTFGYDPNGEQTSETNGLNQGTRYELDSLRRVRIVTDAANASASLGYNALDAVTSATDFKGVPTSYARDAMGNATSETSADTGARATQYDALGLPKQITDALGQATTITRDALGRPTQLAFADGKSTTLTYDSTLSGKGYLASITDRSGTTEYTRDAFGRVTVKKQTLANGSIQQVMYAWRANGLPDSLGYPNGSLLQYQYDTTGRLTGLAWNGQPLVSDITWNALGQPTGWTWAFSTTTPKLSASRGYDTAARLTATEFGSFTYDAAGRIASITQNLWQPADSNPLGTTVTNANVSWSAGYHATGRLTSFAVIGASPANSASFGYDANGNRTSSSRSVNGQASSRSYTIATGTNRASGFSQTLGGTTSAVSYGYNANGDLTSDGLRSYSYDAEGRLKAATTGATDSSPTTRYVHNALGQRVFKTEAMYPPQGSSGQALLDFFQRGWNPATDTAGWAFAYDEAGSLLSEMGTGGPQSTGATSHIWLPTANGPMPIATVIDGAPYAVSSDHLNTPRRITDAAGNVLWQWAYSAFGDEEPTLAASRFTNATTVPSAGTTGAQRIAYNLRYPGQYADAESGLYYNYFRSYNANTGRYTQPDPIGLDGGWNRHAYALNNPLSYIDSDGLLAQVAKVGVPGLLLGCAATPGCRDAVSDLLKPPSAPMASNWEDELDFKDNGPKNEFQFGRCNTPEDRDCRNRLIGLKATYTKIKLLDVMGGNTFSLKQMYNESAKSYMRDCPYWEKVPLFWLMGK